MNIGIIVHSQTGNTLSVAQKLEEKLRAEGHAVTLEHLQTVGEVKPGAKDIRFQALPNIGEYDALVFGAPVQAFSLAPVMKSYLAQVTAVQGKRVAFLLTQHFPYPWMGGNRAMKQFRNSTGLRGAVMCGTGIINWSRAGREQQVKEVVATMSRQLCAN